MVVREMTNYEELATRVEALAAYDGRLMAEIDCAVRFPDLRPAETDDHPTVKDRTFDPSSIWTPTGWLMSRNYWRSVDDAISLTEGFVIIHLSDIGADGLPMAVVGDPSRSPSVKCVGIAHNLAAALTAAALRAHASKEALAA